MWSNSISRRLPNVSRTPLREIREPPNALSSPPRVPHASVQTHKNNKRSAVTLTNLAPVVPFLCQRYTGIKPLNITTTCNAHEPYMMQTDGQVTASCISRHTKLMNCPRSAVLTSPPVLYAYMHTCMRTCMVDFKLHLDCFRTKFAAVRY